MEQLIKTAQMMGLGICMRQAYLNHAGCQPAVRAADASRAAEGVDYALLNLVHAEGFHAGNRSAEFTVTEYGAG